MNSAPVVTLTSMPALATALRLMDTTRFQLADLALERPDALATMYRITNDLPTPEAEAEAAKRVLSEVTERMRRLDGAYGEWQLFDAPAYFDLTVDQAAQLVRVVERVSMVHVVFFADLLLPSFQSAASYWRQMYAPAYQALRNQPEQGAQRFIQEIQPAMIAQWQRLLAVVEHARSLLNQDVGFWATNNAEEERTRWLRWWRQEPAPGLIPTLKPDLQQTPTLTLAFDFPLPARRQPGRLRRLRRNQQRRRLHRERMRKR